MNDKIKEALKQLPETPGVYLHKDSSGQIIYVGKAISLKRRVSQYFQNSKNHTAKVRKMVENIDEFEIIRCKSEVDALILECKLIKKYRPKYNIVLRDDKSYPYIKVTVKEDYPRIWKTHRVAEDGCRYFGPYPWNATMNMVVDLLNSFYSLKRCSAQSFPEDHTPCLNYHINSCSGCCTGLVSKEEYRERIEKVLAFLDGDDSEILDALTKKMYEASEEMNYEQAAACRDYIEAVKEMNGMLKDPEKTKDPQFAALRQKERLAGIRQGLNAIFGEELAEGIHRIESYDISHMNGMDSVGGMVVFVDGQPEKTAYRKFKIKTVEGADDVASMKEVLRRRFGPGSHSDELPDLILMDGGLAQVHAAEDILAELNLPIPVCGAAKDDKHRTRAMVYGEKEYNLRSYPMLFSFVGNIQEEVHRFAIAYHHKLRTKQMIHSVLDDIPGIGQKRKLALLAHFGSIDAIKEAKREELLAVPEMSAQSADNLIAFFKAN